MEKFRRVLVLGDSSVGKSSFIESLFDDFPTNNKFNQKTPTPKQELEFPKKTHGCNVSAHLLNEYYPELNDSRGSHVRSASPSSSAATLKESSQTANKGSGMFERNVNSTGPETDYYLELFEVAGALTANLKTLGTKPKDRRLDLGSGQSQR